MTLAVPSRDPKRPPPLPVAPSAAPLSPPHSMRVPKGRGRTETQEIDVSPAVLEARREEEERAWRAQAARAKQALAETEAAEWEALRARMANAPVATPPRPARAPKPALLRARVSPALHEQPAANAQPVPRGGAQADEAEEREWQLLRERARLAEELEWERLIARARAHAREAAPAPGPRLVAWP